MGTITLINPFSGATVERDITDLTQQQLDAYVAVMDDEVCNELANEIAPCSPEEFLAAYAQRVGPKEAGIVILGS
jgi:hypothetical protein